MYSFKLDPPGLVENDQAAKACIRDQDIAARPENKIRSPQLSRQQDQITQSIRRGDRRKQIRRAAGA
jgi:hypothetical protein